jgi:hypothetical protein
MTIFFTIDLKELKYVTLWYGFKISARKKWF